MPNCKGNAFSGGTKFTGWENFAIFDLNLCLNRRLTLKWYEIGPWLLWNVNAMSVLRITKTFKQNWEKIWSTPRPYGTENRYLAPYWWSNFEHSRAPKFGNCNTGEKMFFLGPSFSKSEGQNLRGPNLGNSLVLTRPTPTEYDIQLWNLFPLGNGKWGPQRSKLFDTFMYALVVWAAEIYRCTFYLSMTCSDQILPGERTMGRKEKLLCVDQWPLVA